MLFKVIPLHKECGALFLSLSLSLSLCGVPPYVSLSPHQAQLIAQSIGQSFSVAYQEFLRANGIDPEDLSQREYSDLLNTQDMYNDDLIHFSKSENCKDVSPPPGGAATLSRVVVPSHREPER